MMADKQVGPDQVRDRVRAFKAMDARFFPTKMYMGRITWHEFMQVPEVAQAARSNRGDRAIFMGMEIFVVDEDHHFDIGGFEP